MITINKDYQDFLMSKIEVAPDKGFDIEPDKINPILKPHQRDAVVWAIKGGQRALFESFGLGKTIQQLEILRIIIELNYQSWKDSLSYLKAVELEIAAPMLFELETTQ